MSNQGLFQSACSKSDTLPLGRSSGVWPSGFGLVSLDVIPYGSADLAASAERRMSLEKKPNGPAESAIFARMNGKRWVVV